MYSTRVSTSFVSHLCARARPISTLTIFFEARVKFLSFRPVNCKSLNDRTWWSFTIIALDEARASIPRIADLPNFFRSVSLFAVNFYRTENCSETCRRFRLALRDFFFCGFTVPLSSRNASSKRGCACIYRLEKRLRARWIVL